MVKTVKMLIENYTNILDIVVIFRAELLKA